MSETTELEMLRRLVPELEAEGYEVYLHPKRPLIPSFFRKFSPDAIALRDDKNLVIEVLHKSPQASERLKRITALLRGQDKWQLRVVWVAPTSAQESLQVQNIDAMEGRIAEVRQLAGAGNLEPAMLIAWATFEALARALVPSQFALAQTPGRLVQVLAGEGYITPTEADQLRTLADKRNRLIHGELQVRVSEAELDSFAVILETILQQVPH